MMLALRTLALLMAIAAVMDPVFAGRRRAPLAVDLRLPHRADPQFDESSRLRDEFLQRVGTSVRVNGSDPPLAVIAINDAHFEGAPAVPLFALLSLKPAGVTALAAPPISSLWGQQPRVEASFQGHGAKDRTTTFTLTGPAGAPLDSLQHRWTQDNETFRPSFPLAPATPGFTVLRITADTDGAPSTPVDVPVSTSDRRARVLVFEPRPSWAVGFARQALESDPLFDVRGVARTSRGIATHTAGVLASLAGLPLEEVDAILVGGLDALSEQDLSVLRRFAEERGGSVILVPDARLPETVRSAFELPVMSETLIERPAELRQGETRVLATELLRLPGREKGTPAEALFLASQGRGYVLVSMALDAWRHRGLEGSGFNQFWRGVAVDAAAAAAPAASLAIDPAVARPGDHIDVKVLVRLPLAVDGALRMPHARATLVSAQGENQPLRLWPGTSAGEYRARFEAPAAGRYELRVDLEGLPRQDAVLVVNADAARPSRDRRAEMAFLAELTGGSVFRAEELSRLVDAVRALPAAQEERALRPTRSAWWMLGFVSLLCAEWAMRRKQGLP